MGSKEGIRFSVQGDVGTGNVMLKPRESEKPEERVALTVHEPVTATFALRYLVIFAKAAPLCGSVELGLGPDAPFLLSTTWKLATTVSCSSIWPRRSTSDLGCAVWPGACLGAYESGRTVAWAD